MRVRGASGGEGRGGGKCEERGRETRETRATPAPPPGSPPAGAALGRAETPGRASSSPIPGHRGTRVPPLGRGPGLAVSGGEGSQPGPSASPWNPPPDFCSAGLLCPFLRCPPSDSENPPPPLLQKSGGTAENRREEVRPGESRGEAGKKRESRHQRHPRVASGGPGAPGRPAGRAFPAARLGRRRGRGPQRNAEPQAWSRVEP